MGLGTIQLFHRHVVDTEIPEFIKVNPVIEGIITRFFRRGGGATRLIYPECPLGLLSENNHSRVQVLGEFFIRFIFINPAVAGIGGDEFFFLVMAEPPRDIRSDERS